MKKRHWMFLALILVLASMTLLTACGEPEKTTTTAPTTQPTTTTTTPADEPQYGGTFTMIRVGGITAWDAPTDAVSFLDMMVKEIVYDNIIWYDKEGNVVLRLASDYDVSPDGMTITITLKEGVKFHDGTELTSADVKYQLENYVAFGAKIGVSGGFKNVDSVDTPDRYTVVLNMKKPDGALGMQLAFMGGTINSSTAVQKPTTEENRAKDHVAGAGPFVFVDWMRDVDFNTVRFDDYWQPGLPYLDAYKVNFFADPVSALLAFKNGEGQGLYNILPKDAAELDKEGYQVLTTGYANFVLTPDGDNADSPFADLRVRQAVEYAINKQELADSFGFGYYEKLDQIAPSSATLAYNPTLTTRDYDPDKARQLLEDAGHPNGIDISLYAQLSDNRELLSAIQGYLEAVGMRTKIELGDPARFHGEWSATGWHNGLIFRGYGFTPSFIENLGNWWRHPPAGSMFTSVYYPPNWDARCDAAIEEPDPVKQAAMVQEIVKTIHDEVMSIPIMTNPIIIAFAPNVGGAESYAPVLAHFQSPAGLWLRQ